MRTRRNSQDESLRRSRQRVVARGAAPLPGDLEQLARHAARGGWRSDWALATLLAWPRLKRGEWKAPGKLTKAEAQEVVRAAFLGMGWEPKGYVYQDCPDEIAHQKAEAVQEILGALPVARTHYGLSVDEEEGQASPAAALMRRRPELRGWIDPGRCTRCRGERRVIAYVPGGPNATYPPGFPLERDPYWAPLPYGALISPNFSQWIGVGATFPRLAEWVISLNGGEGRWGVAWTAAEQHQWLAQNSMQAAADNIDGALRDTRQFANALFLGALDQLGLPDSATPAAERRQQEHRKRRKR